MSLIDWIILTSTISFIVIYGVWKNERHKNLYGYIKGSNTTRWWTVGLSVMATQASAITFLSTPGQGFASGMSFVQNYLGQPIALIIVCLFYLNHQADTQLRERIKQLELEKEAMENASKPNSNSQTLTSTNNPTPPPPNLPNSVAGSEKQVQSLT